MATATATPLLPILLLLLFLTLATTVSADRFTVGDSKGWNPGVNYTVWEKKHRPFHVGDWLGISPSRITLVAPQI